MSMIYYKRICLNLNDHTLFILLESMTADISAIITLCSLFCFCACSFAASAPPLETFSNVNTSLITVSGFSAGGAFAIQLHVAYSSVIKGVGSFAGVADTCFATYGFSCMTLPLLENANELIKNVEELEDDDRVDPISNIADHRVYIYHGNEDQVVLPGAADVVEEFYEEFISTSGNIMVSFFLKMYSFRTV